MTLLLSAQNDVSFKHISTGIKVGSEFGLLSLASANTDGNTSAALGYSITIDFIEFRFNERLGVNLGIGYANRKYLQVIENIYSPEIKGNSIVREHLLMQNIEIPLTFKYYLPKKSAIRQAYFSLGSSLYFNLHNEFKQEVTFEESIWEFNHQSEVQRTTYAGYFNFGIQFFTNRKVSYYIEPTLQINPNMIDFQYGNNSNLLINISLLGGIKF